MFLQLSPRRSYRSESQSPQACPREGQAFPARLSWEESHWKLLLVFPSVGAFLLFIRGDPLQYSCLENPVGRGAWKAAVHGVTRSRM